MELLNPRKRRSKYGNTRCILDGLTFDSLAECGYYVLLRDRQRRGDIAMLQHHWRYPVAKGVVYEADFAYWDRAGTSHVVDVKGVATPVFRLKAKLFRACYGYPIELVKPTRGLVDLARAAGAKEVQP
jgi:hypothetical protein